MQHIFSLEIVGADKGALLQKHGVGASSLMCSGLNGVWQQANAIWAGHSKPHLYVKRTRN